MASSQRTTRVGCKSKRSSLLEREIDSSIDPPSKGMKHCTARINFDYGSSITTFFSLSAAAGSTSSLHPEKMICALEENQSSTDESNITTVGNCSIYGQHETSNTSHLAQREVTQLFTEETLSPSNTKARRAAELRSRFADLIAKSQQTLQDQGKNGRDLVKLQFERENLNATKQKELLSLEAEKRKLKIAKKQEAARRALQHVKRSVEIDNSGLQWDLKRLHFSFLM